MVYAKAHTCFLGFPRNPWDYENFANLSKHFHPSRHGIVEVENRNMPTQDGRFKRYFKASIDGLEDIPDLATRRRIHRRRKALAYYFSYHGLLRARNQTPAEMAGKATLRPGYDPPLPLPKAKAKAKPKRKKAKKTGDATDSGSDVPLTQTSRSGPAARSPFTTTYRDRSLMFNYNHDPIYVLSADAVDNAEIDDSAAFEPIADTRKARKDLDLSDSDVDLDYSHLNAQAYWSGSDYWREHFKELMSRHKLRDTLVQVMEETEGTPRQIHAKLTQGHGVSKVSNDQFKSNFVSYSRKSGILRHCNQCNERLSYGFLLSRRRSTFDD